MRRFLLSPAVLIALVVSVQFAQAAKDTPAANNTRTKKLTAVISVDFADTPLKDCVTELHQQVEDAGGGAISFNLAVGVSMNKKITFKADKKTLAEVLDGMFKKEGLGYIVESKANDRQDGWVIIRVGKERGHPEGEEPVATTKPAGKKPPEKTEKPKEEMKEDPAKDPKEAASGEDAAEADARKKLNLAKALIKDGVIGKGKERLRVVIKDFPKTKAAEEAKAELEKLK